MDRREEFRHRSAAAITAEFSSLAQALDYIDSVAANVASIGERELIDVLACFAVVYGEFPELSILRPRGDLYDRLWSAEAKFLTSMSSSLPADFLKYAPTSAVIQIINKIIEADYLSSLLRYFKSRSIRENVDQLVNILDYLIAHGKDDLALELISQMLGSFDVDGKREVCRLGSILAGLLSDGAAGPLANDALAKIAQSARRRLSGPPRGRDERETREAVLARAERLKPAVWPRGPHPSAKSGWPSGAMPFDDFVLQWPCRVELPDNLNDRGFVDETYEAILLRAPLAAEMTQWLRLLQTGEISRAWIIEELLASEERHSIERQVRVIWRGRVIAEPGIPQIAEMPSVTLPVRRRS
jgi:hypothetical protein